MVIAPAPLKIKEHQRDDGHDIAALDGQCLRHDAIAFTVDLEPLPMRGRFKGADALLILGGPSLNDVDLDALAHGRLTLAVNNAGAIFQSAMWIGNDDPDKFHESIWTDPCVEKFVPAQHRNSDLRTDSATGPKRSARRVRDMPNMRLYRRRLDFNPETFLTTNALQLGCDRDIPCSLGIKGKRSTMLSAINLLAHFGVAEIALVGCDFRMDTAKPYAFDEVRHRTQVFHNNDAYPHHAARFKALRPVLEAAGTRIVNASPGSALDAFDLVDWRSIVKPRREIRTRGWYRK